MTTGRDGIVLAGVVLAILTMALLAHAAVLLARLETAASRTSLGVTRARVAAESGLVRAGASPLPRSADSLAVGSALAWSADDLGPARYETELIRLAPELWLVESLGQDRAGEGAPGSLGVRRSAAAWRLDPVQRVRAAEAVVEVGAGADVSGPVATAGWFDGSAEGPAAGCAEPSGPVPPPWAAVVDPPGDGGVPGLGALPGHAVAAALVPLPAAEGTPAPVRHGAACAQGVWNWGDPLAPAGEACASRYAAVSAHGDLTLRGGVGQGVLAVAGNLTLSDDAHFAGVALVGGFVHLGPGATLVGHVRAGGEVVVDADATVQGSACAAARALWAATALTVLVPLPGWDRMGGWRSGG